jgi:hypothetical protein
MKKLLTSFDYPFIIKIFVRSQQATRTIYTQRKIVYVGEFTDTNVREALIELFPFSQYVETLVNVANIDSFPAYKVFISTIDGNFTETKFYNLR